ncbi:transcriptional attenuator, LytR family [Sanguibacter gelidistatuariae]|uniref:Transcriptional attenuator, LytR family n=1 Tax=Sanguibacter gelidistatuariae TaxID=1814289 RepID=A0A1G6QN49_9MICO|nr:LCP family protein [Sanguibacter gelidistatuariae]SDC93743.1 transcriptional attenuator, LytR family [Sanguibacter gelidistatuariae]
MTRSVAPLPLAHARTRPRRRAARTAGIVCVGALTFAVVGAGAAFWTLDHNIARLPVSDLLSDRPPAPVRDPQDPNAGVPVNILLLGSDTREGDNLALGGADGSVASDTTLVVHLSADRSRVEVVSIPRDSIVDVPECRTTSGKVLPAVKDTMFNHAFSRGWFNGGDLTSATACAMATVESLTGIYLDGAIVADFNGFSAMVEALGGVPITIPEAISSPKAGGLVLAAGYQVLTPWEATQLSRARTGTGWGLEIGSDLKRIERQQALLAAMATAVTEKNLLTDLPALTQFVSAATKSLTVSDSLSSVRDLTGLALSLKATGTDNIVFTKVPVAEAPQDKDRVVWTDAAGPLWERIKADQPPTGADQ